MQLPDQSFTGSTVLSSRHIGLLAASIAPRKSEVA
jgi:hypothetical protein